MSIRASGLRCALAATLLGALLSSVPRASAQVAPSDPAAPVGASAAATSPTAPSPTATSPAAPIPAGDDIRDIRGAKFILPAWLIPAAVALALLLAVGGYALWRWLKQRRRPRNLLPFELALQQLDGIRPLMQPVTAREFSIAVSDIVRGYIEQRFDVTAIYQTTEEFLYDLLKSTKPSLARHRGLLSEFLQQCDLVKFGGMSLSARSMESLHDSARGFVLHTAAPDPVAVPEKAYDSLPST